ncbi:hypothetical protein HK102_012164, partial [Quaeritorhiza haematococci]
RHNPPAPLATRRRRGEGRGGRTRAVEGRLDALGGRRLRPSGRPTRSEGRKGRRGDRPAERQLPLRPVARRIARPTLRQPLGTRRGRRRRDGRTDGRRVVEDRGAPERDAPHPGRAVPVRGERQPQHGERLRRRGRTPAGDDRHGDPPQGPFGGHAEFAGDHARRVDPVRGQRQHQRRRRGQHRRPGPQRPAGFHPRRVVSDLGAVVARREVALDRQRQGNLVQGQSRRPRPGRGHPFAPRIHRRAAERHALHPPDAHSPADGGVHQDRLRVLPAGRRGGGDGVGAEAAGRQPHPRQGRRTLADQVLHLHRQGEPHLRPGLRRHARGERRSQDLPLPGGDHAESPRPGPRVRPARQLLRRRR